MEIILLLCAVVIALCIFTNRFTTKIGIPAVLVFMAIGMIFGSEGILKIPFDNFNQTEMICSAALIFIMFYGGFGTNFKTAKPVLAPAVCLATLGVLLTAVLTGVFCIVVLKMKVMEGLLLGSVVASTDAASVFSILRSKQLNLKNKTASLLELESGSNDPAAYMLTMIILGIMSDNVNNIAIMLFKQVMFGIIFGLGSGYIVYKSLKNIDFEIEGSDTILMIAMVLFSYAAPSLLGGNGYLSVYLFGLYIGNKNFDNKITMVHFFDEINQLAQILIFFLLGLLVYPSRLIPMAGTALLVFDGLTFIARPLAVFLIMTPFKAEFRQQVLIAFSGLRGAASIVFAIMVTVSPVYSKIDVFNIVFCVALISVAFQGLLLPKVAHILDMVDEEQDVMKTFNDYNADDDIRLIQMNMEPGHKYIGKRINELRIKNMLIILIERGNDTLMPRSDVVIEEGDILVLSAKSYKGNIKTVLNEERIGLDDIRVGKKIQELANEDDNRFIVIIKRMDGSNIIPKGNTTIKGGDILIYSKIN